jgi:glycosyltransferase involved in cell wall biosynthesis
MVPSVGTRVLMLLENNPYPKDARVRMEAQALVSAGHKVSVICPSGPTQPRRELLDGVHLYRFPAPSAANGFLGYLWEYGYSTVATFIISLFIFLREGFDVVHAHCPPDTFFLIAAFYRLLGKRFVYDHHDLAPELYYYVRFREGGSRLVYQALVVLERISCRVADCVIVTNESQKTMAIARGQTRVERITIVRNGPDLESLHLVRPDPDLREKAGTILGYIGIMGPQDGVDYLLRALHQLVYHLDRHDVFCIIIGDGDELLGLKAMAKHLDIEEIVWFTGWIQDQDLLSRYLSAVDICVDPDPSNVYNDGCTMMKMAEYMALGKPIVAFDLPEHRVTAQDAAVYARPNDELDFAEKIALLMDSPDMYGQMGQRGRKRVETELAWQHQEKHLLRVYEALGAGLPRR